MLFYAHVLSQEAYGEYQNVWIRLAVMGTFAYAGLPALCLSYSAPELKQFSRGIGRRLKVLLPAWALLWGLGYAWMQWAQDGIPLLLSLLLLLLYALNALQESLIIVAGRSGNVVLAAFGYTAGYVLLHYRAWERGYQLEWLLWGLAALGVLRCLYYTWVIRKSYRAVAAASGAIPAGTGRFWFHSGLYDLLQTVFRWADKFIISLLLAEAVSAVYFNGSQDIPFVSLLLGAFSSTVLVRVAADKTQDAVVLMRYTGRILSCLMFPLFYFLLLYRYELFGLAFGEKYRDSVPVFAVTVLLLPLRAYGFGTLLQSRKEGRIINTGAIMDLLLAFALMYPLYRWLGLPGIALSFVCSTVVQCAYYLFHTARLYRVRAAALLPLKNWAFKLIIFGILFIALRYTTQVWTDAYIRLSLGAGLALLTAAVSFFNEIKHPPAPDVENTTQNKVQEH